MNKIVPIILCGGSGSRLFPLSRKNIPKQFLILDKNGYSLLQNTILRLTNIDSINEIALISNINYENILKNQVDYLNLNLKVRYFFEPTSRNTCPAITYVLLYYYKNLFSGNLLFLPSDHIYDNNEFNNLFDNLINSYLNNICVVFGIKPTYPETGFGYIEYENKKVISFKEKPNEENANMYVNSGKYCWNSGMFMFNNKILKYIEKFNLEIFITLEKIIDSYQKDCIYIDDLYSNCKDISIDYALIENIPNKLTFYYYNGFWSDIGSYKSLLNFSNEYFAFNSSNNYINCKKKVIANEISDLAIVETNDLILVSKLDKSQNIKNIYNEISKDLLINNYIDYRPWGFYEILNDENNFKSKKITVYPNKKLSLQSHQFRCEHWICLDGNGIAQINDDLIKLQKNSQVFINFKQKHRLINSDDSKNLIIIEIQTGSYFGEDDII